MLKKNHGINDYIQGRRILQTQFTFSSLLHLRVLPPHPWPSSCLAFPGSLQIQLLFLCLLFMKLNNGETSLAFGILHLNHLCVWRAAAVFVVGSPFCLSEHTATEKSRQRKKRKRKKKSSISAATFSWNEMARDHCFMAHPSVQMEGLLKASAWQPQLHVAGQPQRSRAAAMPQCGCPLRDPHTGTHDRAVPCTSRSLRGALQRCQQYWALANESKPILTEEWSKAGSTVLSLTVN